MKKLLALFCVAALAMGANAGVKVNMPVIGSSNTETLTKDDGSMLIAKAPKKHHKCCRNCKRGKACNCKKFSKNCSKNCRACRRHIRPNNLNPQPYGHHNNLNPQPGHHNDHHGNFDPQPGNHNPQPGGNHPQPGHNH